DRGDDHAELGGDLAADHRHPADQRPAGAAVDQRNQPEADAELERIDRELLEDLLARGGRLVGLGRDGQRRRSGRGGQLVRHAVADRPADRGHDPADEEERDLGQPRHGGEADNDHTGDQRRLALAQDLVGQVGPEVLVRAARASDDDAGRDRDQQGGDLGGQAVADGQQRVGVGGLREADVKLKHADHDPADQVDRGDHDGGHGIALDELRGTVHGPVEVGLAADLGAPVAGLVVGDQAGVEVGVDRHLLAGHGVEGEPGGHLGHAAGAVGHHDELDDDQDQEDDQTDHHVA